MSTEDFWGAFYQPCRHGLMTGYCDECSKPLFPEEAKRTALRERVESERAKGLEQENRTLRQKNESLRAEISTWQARYTALERVNAYLSSRVEGLERLITEGGPGRGRKK